MIPKETLDRIDRCVNQPNPPYSGNSIYGISHYDIQQLITAARKLSRSQELVQQFQIDVNSARNALSLANQAMVGKLAELESSQSQIETHIQTELEQRKKIDQLRLGISDKRNELESVKAELKFVRELRTEDFYNTSLSNGDLVASISVLLPGHIPYPKTFGQAIDAAKEKSPNP